jgi:hypothetical protein
MCDFGISLMITSVVLAATSAAVGSTAAIQQAAFASNMGKNKAKAEDIAAGQARDEGQQAAFNIQQEGAQNASEVAAESAASGVDTQQSSIGGITDRMAAGDVLGQKAVQVSAMRSAWGYEYAADQSRANADQATLSGAYGASGSILGGLGSMASAYGTYRNRDSKLNTNFKTKLADVPNWKL